MSVPRVHHADGPDLVLRRLHGPTLAGEIVTGHTEVWSAAGILVDLHRRLHALPARRPGGAEDARKTRAAGTRAARRSGGPDPGHDGLRRCGGSMTGRLARLWRYPVKSMLGERLAAAEVGRAGVAGDRGLALLHRESGRVASAKHPRLWRALLTLRASGGGPDPVRITLPDGQVVSTVDGDADEVLSTVLGRPVSLVDAPPAGATPDRAHPDAVLADGVPRSAAALRVPADLNRAAPLPQLGPQPCVGAYAQVVRGGRVEQGAEVEVG